MNVPVRIYGTGCFFYKKCGIPELYERRVHLSVNNDKKCVIFNRLFGLSVYDTKSEV